MSVHVVTAGQLTDKLFLQTLSNLNRLITERRVAPMSDMKQGSNRVCSHHGRLIINFYPSQNEKVRINPLWPH